MRRAIVVMLNTCFWLDMMLAAWNIAVGHMGWAVYSMIVGWFCMTIADKWEAKYESKSDSDIVQ